MTRLKFLQAASSSSREESQTPSDSDPKQTHFDIFKELQKLRDEEESDSSCDDEDQVGLDLLLRGCNYSFFGFEGDSVPAFDPGQTGGKGAAEYGYSESLRGQQGLLVGV